MLDTIYQDEEEYFEEEDRRFAEAYRAEGKFQEVLKAKRDRLAVLDERIEFYRDMLRDSQITSDGCTYAHYIHACTHSDLDTAVREREALVEEIEEMEAI